MSVKVIVSVISVGVRAQSKQIVMDVVIISVLPVKSPGLELIAP